MLMKVGQQMLRKLGQQMLTKIDRQLFHTIATDARLAGANQQMFLTYTIDYVTPDRFFCLAWWLPSYHYSYVLLLFSSLLYSTLLYATQLYSPPLSPSLPRGGSTIGDASPSTSYVC